MSDARSEPDDARFMQACLRYALRHEGRTGTNPAVGTLLVRDGVIVGRGVTALGGRPHAETIAIGQAGEAACGSTAYVSLEPCAHHGVTPPCAQALIEAGVSRVVTAYADPDVRVDGRGHAMLRDAGVAVAVGCQAEHAARDLAGYLSRKTSGLPHVTLKLAQTADGFLGREGEETPITGPIARAQVHALRARHDAILVGRGTLDADDPDLTVRLPGLEARSPHRVVLADDLSAGSALARTARAVPVSLATSKTLRPELVALGIRHLAAERHDGEIALPELLEDLAARGFSSVMVEGGARVAASFLEGQLVGRVVLFTAPHTLEYGIAAPALEGFAPVDERRYGDDVCTVLERS